MRLKCIGGKHDGEYYDIPDDRRIGDVWQIPKISASNYQHFTIEPEPIAYTTTIYRIAIFHFSKDDIYKFLVPEGWTDKEAILHQFTINDKKLH